MRAKYLFSQCIIQFKKEKWGIISTKVTKLTSNKIICWQDLIIILTAFSCFKIIWGKTQNSIQNVKPRNEKSLEKTL